MSKPSLNILIGLSLLCAGILMQVPLPSTVEIVRPDFFMLILMYWWLAHPEKVGIFFAFFCGLIVDVMHGVLLGQNAFGAVLIAFLIIKNYQRIRVLPLHQQAPIIALLLALKQLFVFWVDSNRGAANFNVLMYLLSAVAGGVLWPWLFVLMRDLRRNTRKYPKSIQ